MEEGLGTAMRPSLGEDLRPTSPELCEACVLEEHRPLETAWQFRGAWENDGSSEKASCT